MNEWKKIKIAFLLIYAALNVSKLGLKQICKRIFNQKIYFEHVHRVAQKITENFCIMTG